MRTSYPPAEKNSTAICIQTRNNYDNLSSNDQEETNRGRPITPNTTTIKEKTLRMRTLDKKTKIEKLRQRRFESPVKRIDPPPPPPAAAVPVAVSQNLEESVNQLPSPEPEPNSESNPESSSPTKQEYSISQNLERVR